MKTKQPTIPGNLALDDVLAEMLPNLKRGMRRKRFADFLRSEIRATGLIFGDNFTDPEIDRIALVNIDIYDKEGLLPTKADSYRTKMEAWHKTDVGTKRSKAAKVKHANAAKLKAAKAAAKAKRANRAKAPKRRFIRMDNNKLDLAQQKGAILQD
jgi:hypothetical protein